MRSFKQYLTESIHRYGVTIKIVGTLDDKLMDQFKFNLKKFDPVEITGPTVTPVQKTPVGFPEHKNQEVSILKANFRYPATEPMVRQMARLIGIDENRVRLIPDGYEDSLEYEKEQYENQMKNSPLLTSEYPENKTAKEAADAYGNSYLDYIQEQSKDSEVEMEFAGEKTKLVFDPFKPEEYIKSMGNKSPMTTITRPAKPATGAGK